MRSHWHTDAIHIGITAAGVALVFHVIRLVSARLVASDSTPVSNVGKAVGGFFSFPAGS